MTERAPYKTDLTDAKWLAIEGFMPDPASTGRPREVAFREVINTILSILSDGKLVSDMNSRKIYNEDYFKKYGVLRETCSSLARERTLIKNTLLQYGLISQKGAMMTSRK